MSRVNGITYSQDPAGYYIRDPKKLEQIEANEDHLIKGGIIKDARVASDKLAKGILVYPKKGLKGSKNSNFYEFLTMTAVPTIAGSGMLIALYNLLRRRGSKDFAQVIKGEQVIASVLLYAVGKWLGNKAISLGTKAATGVDMDMTYKSYKSKLPEFNGDKNLISEEFHKVYESVDFPRWDILNKEGMKSGNKYSYYDKIAKRMGIKETLNAPDQEIQPRIKKVVVKARAASSISQYLWAALGVCIGSHYQVPTDAGTSFKNALNPKIIFQRLKGAAKEFYNGTSKGKTLSAEHIKKNKIFAYGLTALALGTTLFGILNTRIGYKVKSEEKVINPKEPYVEA